MKVVVYSARSFDRKALTAANSEAGSPHQLHFLDTEDGMSRVGPRLSPLTAGFAEGHDAVSVFTNDDLGRETLSVLSETGCRRIALRSAGFNTLDVAAAREMGFRIARVPAYSPHAVAEHTVALLLAINRKIHRAHARVREQNFSLEGLLGVDLHGKTATIVGTGRIGAVLARILLGFGCHVIGVDPTVDEDLVAHGVEYRSFHDALPDTRFLLLTCPLNEGTRHLVDAEAISLLPRGAFLVNTARGAVLDTRALIGALKQGHFAGVALDVYEEEESLFFEDRSHSILVDDVFARLLTFSNVLITSHQAFFTEEAIGAIAATTIANLTAMEGDGAVLPANAIPGL